MSVLKFKCTLLSDVIINQKAATEGNQSTLDFIPGNNFLGIVASSVYSKNPALALDILHSGKVRFGDAHPAINGARALRIPASCFYPKLGSFKEKCYVHHEIADFAALKSLQLKQCRNSFVAFVANSFTDVAVSTTFAIKSAYDRDSRRAKDAQMYGYESLDKGLELYFDVDFDASVASECVKLVCQSLEGDKRVGRSKTAQYGLVHIERTEFNEPESNANSRDITVAYADGRLIFLDEYGMPTFTPTAEQLGCAGGKILWEKSQVRTFQYSPWNFKRQARDMDRCGIEKGSVFVIQGGSPDISKRYIGEFKNEGFGKVIYNPSFLKTHPNENGLLALEYKPIEHASPKANVELAGTPLLNFLKKAKKCNDDSASVFRMTNEFVETFSGNWCGETFASQWGAIRSIAGKWNTRSEIIHELFEDGNKDAYLLHGCAADKWRENQRLEIFRNFLTDKEANALSDIAFKELVINIASEMSKKIQGGV